MDKLKQLINKRYFWFTLIAVLNLFIYRQLIVADPVLNFDDHSILDPLYQTTSVHHYFQRFFAGDILDLQPIRDLSIMLDLQFIQSLPFWSVHLTNVILWVVTICVMCLVAQELMQKSAMIFAVGLLISVHPVASVSISWIAARKHLLGLFFVVLAIFVLVKAVKNKKFYKRSAVLIFLFYAMGILSHPIVLLWPLWSLVYFYLTNSKEFWRRGLWLCGPSLVVMCAFAIWNYNYYTNLYLQHFGPAKIMNSFDFSSAVLAVGRYTYNILFPFHVSVTYYPGAIYNLIGVVLLPLFIWLCFKTLQLRPLMVWLLLMILPLAIVIGRQANVFVADTYLLIPLMGYFILIVSMLNQIFLNQKKMIKYGSLSIFVLLILFMLNTKSIAESFESDAAVWQRAKQVEETPFVLSQLTLMEFNKKNYEIAFVMAQRLYNWNPAHPLAVQILAKTLYYYPLWNVQQKIKYFEHLNIDDHWYVYTLSALYAEDKMYQKAYDILLPLSKKSFLFTESAERIAAELTVYCLLSVKKDCGLIKDDFKNSLKPRRAVWDEQKYIQTMNELKTLPK